DSGATVQTGSIQLLANESTTITVSGPSSTYTFSTANDNSLTTTVALSKCVQVVQPKLTVSAACTSNNNIPRTATFVVKNNGGDMVVPHDYEIVDANNNSIQKGTFQLKAGEEITINVSGLSRTYKFNDLTEPTLTAEADMTTCGGVLFV